MGAHAAADGIEPFRGAQLVEPRPAYFHQGTSRALAGLESPDLLFADADLARPLSQRVPGSRPGVEAGEPELLGWLPAMPCNAACNAPLPRINTGRIA